MEPKIKRILIIAIILIAILALILGLVFGLRKTKKNDKEDDVEIINSYDNTEELIKKFPVINPTTVKTGLEERIQNRLLTGFENWNRGFKAWKKWGDILYTNASIYNVHGARLTLSQYQAAMDIALKQTTILMGDFHNMLICEDFTAIYYDFITVVGENKIYGTVMEFVKFKDYENNLGTRVVVGWGSTKDDSYHGMINFQGDDEKMIQAEQELLLKNYKIPSETNLRLKYPVLYPSNYTGNLKANAFIDIILEGFDKWNEDKDSYLNFVDKKYSTDAISCGLEGKNRTMIEYKSEINSLFDREKIEKLYFNNILIRDDWAALHYRYRRVVTSTNEKSVGDRMQFLKFKQDGDEYIIEASFVQ